MGLRLQRFSIRTQVFLLAVMILLPASVLLAWFLATEVRVAREDAFAKVRVLADDTAGKLELILHDYGAVLGRLASRPAIAALDPRKVDVIVAEFVDIHPEFANLGVRDLEGNNVYSHYGSPVNARIAKASPWFLAGISANDFLAGDAFFRQQVGSWTSVLSVPIHDGAGKISGLLIAPLDLAKFNQRIFQHPQATAVIGVVDAKFTVLLRSVDAGKYIGKPAPAELAEAVGTSRAGYFSATDLTGVRRLSAFTGVAGTNWRVIAGVPEDEAFATYRSTLRRSLTVGLGMILLALLLAWRVSIAITTPIMHLATAAEKVAGGDHAARAGVAGPAEIALVARQFNAMLDARDANEAALFGNETRFRELFEGNPHPMWIFEIETLAFLTVNDAAVAHYGYSREEFLAMTIRDIRPQEDINRLMADVEQAGAGQREAQVWRHRRKDGSIIIVEITAHSLTFANRSARFIFAHDVTARTNAEEKLRRSEESLAITLQSIGDAVIATNDEGVITRMNPTAERMTGWPQADAVGQPLEKVFCIFNAATGTPMKSPVTSVVANREIARLKIDTVLRARDGRQYQIADSAAPIRDPDGRTVGVVLVFSDVTDAYRVQQDLARTLTLLERTGEVARVGGWELDLKAMKLFWTAEIFRIHEMAVTTSPTIEQGLSMFAPAAQPIMQAAIQAAIDHGTPYDLTLPKFTASGREIWARVQGSAVMENGKAIKLFGALQDVTERKAAELALQESEARYRAIVEWSPEPFAVYRNGVVIYVNPAAVKLFGATSSHELVGKSVLELAHPDARQVVRDRMSHFAAGGTTVPLVEMKGRRLDGTEIDVEVQSAMIVYGGEPAIHAALRDITASKRAATALRESEAFNVAILDSVNAEIAVLDRDGTIISVNQPWQRFARENVLGSGGPPPNVAVGANYFAVCRTAAGFASDTAQSACEGIQAVLAGDRSSFSLEYACHSPGKQRWFSMNVTPLGPDGRGVVVAHTNITDRKQAEASRAAIIDSSMDAIISVDEDENISVFNKAAEALFQINSAEAIGQKIDRFIPARFRSDHHAHILNFMKSGVTARQMGQFTKLRAMRLDGTEFPIEASISHVEAGSKHLFTVTLRDNTERERAEGTRALLEAQLRESQKMEAIGTLAGGIAHDFNNILVTILGNTELARGDLKGNPQAMQSLDQIHKAGSRARDLVQQILSFSRRQPTERKAISLAPVIADAVRLLRTTLPPRQVLKVDCDKDAPAVMADATQVEQVVINLVTNAMHALRDRAGHINIRLDAVTLDAALMNDYPALQSLSGRQLSRLVRLSVSDDGDGMDGATIGRIFEPFFTTKPVDKGTGLGLSVVHGIVQAHEGAITVESRPGTGSTFSVYLPAAAKQDAAIRSRELTAAERAPAAVKGTGRHILYLDDDESLVLLVTRMLELRGYGINGYIDQQTALAAVRADPARFDLLVTDYNMPGMSGLDVAREVRKIRPDLPVVVASGFIDEALRAQADGAGIRELIFKANAAEDLCDAFVRLVNTLA